ncbi:DUF1934 domain-containing protein [Peribacillus tepidiphilus]|uniref:DUF1934 domain-containing protein n=1 Tax=Peribacillus tepidiphilus TaxID=2652445 RepID=UPI0035B4FC0C
MSEKKNVKVHLKTTITTGEDTETYEFLTFGTSQLKGNTLYLQYEEVQEDHQKVQTTVKWTDEEAFIMRSGAIKMRQRFIRDAHTIGVYESPYGALNMKTLTKKMEYSWNNHTKEGKIILIYELAIQGNEIGRYEMTIGYKEENIQ